MWVNKHLLDRIVDFAVFWKQSDSILGIIADGKLLHMCHGGLLCHFVQPHKHFLFLVTLLSLTRGPKAFAGKLLVLNTAAVRCED